MHRLKSGVSNWQAMLAIALAFFAVATGPLSAKDDGAGAPEQIEQIKLTEAHIKGYIKVAPNLAKLFERMDKAGDKPDKQLTADLDALTKDGGFKSFDELEVVISNITFVMSGMNEEDGSFREPIEVLKEELKATEDDKEIKADEKKQMIESIKESIARTPKLAHPSNVALVKKYYKQLATLFKE